ncbi:uncharacterized protein LOC133905563 [Phragmites australis]|uniref:uncharacterized protein LOC133905563 n=1 Tax=Phragmites australis TaxID=29695 RepID=UPI002D78E711|nr:uncharacterized protein LOC133905563 [Phragmites australis]
MRALLPRAASLLRVAAAAGPASRPPCPALHCLRDAVCGGKLLVLEDLEVPSHKAKNIVNYISQMDNTEKVMLVDGGDIDKKLKLATQNLHYVNVLPSIGLKVYSILQHDTLIMTRDVVHRIVERMHTPINR